MTARDGSGAAKAPDLRWVLVATIVASGMVFLDGTIVSVALPRIALDLPTGVLGRLEAQTYITSGYLAVLAAFLVLAGALADKYGRRRIFIIGLAGFGLTSVLCGLAPSMEVLVLARLLQGFAGALLVPGSLSIITAAFDGSARARAFGIWAAATSALTILGPLVGGILVDTVSWRAAFLVNVPFTVIGLYAAWRYVPESRDPDAPRRLDWLGSIVIALAVGGLAFGIVRGQETGWSDTASLVALGIGLVAAILFPILMVKRRDPLVPPHLFRRRAFTVINLSTLLIYSALYTTQFLQSVFLQGVLGYTALAAALIGSLPAGLLLTLASTRVGTVAGRVGVWPFLVIGPLLMAGGQLWLARIPATSVPWTAEVGDPSTWLPPTSSLIDVLPSVLLFGIGITLVVAPLTTALMGSIPVANAGIGSAINNAISRVGQPLVLALLFVVITATFYDSLEDKLPSVDVGSAAVQEQVQPLNPADAAMGADVAVASVEASTGSFHLAMLATAGLLIAGGLTNAFGLRRGTGAAPREPETVTMEPPVAVG